MKFKVRLFRWAPIVFIIAHFSLGSCQESKTPDKVTLRSETASLSQKELLQIIKDKGLHSPGDMIKGSFKHRYESAELKGIKVVIDHSTSLMWQQTEDKTRFDWREAEAFVEKMNEENLAGFSDWRLPTVEELLSLMESKKTNKIYMNPLFQKGLLSTWTIDVVKDAFAGAWFVDFTEGKAVDGNRAAGMGHVRLVRTYK